MLPSPLRTCGVALPVTKTTYTTTLTVEPATSTAVAFGSSALEIKQHLQSMIIIVHEQQAHCMYPAMAVLTTTAYSICRNKSTHSSDATTKCS
jgi:hypothetical protein